MDDDIYASGGADFIQSERNLQISTPIGKDIILPERCEIREGVNSLFEFHIAVRSKKSDLQASDLIGKIVDISLELDRASGQRRYWSGLTTELHAGPRITRGLRSYALTIRPQLWLLSQKSNCRIWQNQTALQVLDTLLSEHNLPAASKGPMHPQLTPQLYSVQWNETDLDYLRRRLEEDGIFFWHKHKQGEHRLYVASHKTGYLNGDPMDVRLSFGSADRNHITSWNERFAYTPGRRTGSDWNFEKPSGAQTGTNKSAADLPIASNYELYEYPARISDNKEGEGAARHRMDAFDADYHRITGESSVRTLAPAERFKPYEEAEPKNVYEKHIILDITHRIVNRSYETNTNEPEYLNEFSALPDQYPATPHRDTKRPRIDGLQTAIISGPSGEEIHTDQYGRIKVWFPWDRQAKKDGSDTCWMRVAQNWAGAQWGGQIIPRVGMEAMVSFVEGDPDRPIVVGLVPNPKDPVPYPLPDHKTRSVFKTKTYQGQGFNELYFDDKTSNEEIYMHAQRDMNIDVLNDRTKTVNHDQSESVGNNKAISVGVDHTESIGNNMSLSVGTNQTESVGQSKTLNVGQSFGRTVGRVSTEQVGKDKATYVGENQMVYVGSNKQENITKSYNLTVGENAGFEVGKIFEIKATDTFRVQVGSARLQMDSSGLITIESPHSTIAKGGGTQLTIGPGPVLYTPALTPGAMPTAPAVCLKKLAAQMASFIKPGS